jgi:cytoskeletal protein RodZ
MNKFEEFLSKDKRIVPGILALLGVVLVIVLMSSLSSAPNDEQDEQLTVDSGQSTVESESESEPESESATETTTAAESETTESTAAATESETTETTTSAESETTATESATTTETTTESTSAAGAEEGITMTYTTGTPWQEGGRWITEVRTLITNNTDRTITDWTVTMEVPAGARVRGNGWNAVYSISGTTLTISRERNGRDLRPGESFPDAGFHLETDEPFEP